ncbi:GIY-YIG nuclease family protein [Salinibacter ruber]|uniref:GIY-YIG nuclease family protein n=1 Tax=Salinibacter ruber TaxID=146919 RepID=UPI00207468D7|nr:GIY-YIG nuclease family protein [Salinibacter ruber]
MPENGGVYRLNDLRGTLYVGKTNSLRRRFQEHLDPNNWLIQQALQHRDGRLKFGWKAISSSEKRGQQERQLIQYYEPPCNRVMFEGE